MREEGGGRHMSIGRQYANVRAATDFWMYLLVWSEIGRRPAWIEGKK